MTDTLRANLQALASDMSSQINALKHRNDISWDCYDIGNWKSSLSSVKAIASELNISLDSEVDNETA